MREEAEADSEAGDDEAVCGDAVGDDNDGDDAVVRGGGDEDPVAWLRDPLESLKL